MYKISHDKAQAGRDRLKLADLASAGAPEVQTTEQQRANLIIKMKSIEAAIKVCADKEQKRALGVEKLALQNAVHELRAKKRCPEATQHFINCAREMLPKFQFQQIMSAAVARSKANVDGSVDEQTQS